MAIRGLTGFTHLLPTEPSRAPICPSARNPEGAVPGLQPSDIRDYNLPSDKLSDKDVEALNAELTNPRFATEDWKKQIHLQLELGLKSEQQAFAARGLDFVTKKYLPARLSEMGVIRV